MAEKVLTNQMNALLAYANEATGSSDTRLGDAVRTLVDGYGSGGSSGGLELVFEDPGVYINHTTSGVTVYKTIDGSSFLNFDSTTSLIFVLERNGETPTGYIFKSVAYVNTANVTCGYTYRFNDFATILFAKSSNAAGYYTDIYVNNTSDIRGVYIDSFGTSSTNKTFNICAKYKSCGTIDGTFSLKVYKISL